jgi:integrase
MPATLGTSLVTEHDRPLTAAGFGNWFRDRCDEAGLKWLSAHGMRKAAATRAAERAATAHQLMAIFGWRTIKQAEVYTRAAERKRLAGAAMHLLGTDGGQESLTFNHQPPR